MAVGRAAVSAEVLENISGCVSLDHLQLVNVCFGVWAPHSEGIFQLWFSICLVAVLFDIPRTVTSISVQKPQCAVSFFGDGIHMVIPRQLTVYVYSKVFSCIRQCFISFGLTGCLFTFWLWYVISRRF